MDVLSAGAALPTSAPWQGKRRSAGQASWRRRKPLGPRHADIALKHRVSLSALKYHVYKARRGERSVAPRLLPVRIGAEPALLQAQVGAIRVSFSEGCSPSYVAALLTALAKAAC